MPLSAGGPDTLANAQTLCVTCHRAKTAYERVNTRQRGGPQVFVHQWGATTKLDRNRVIADLVRTSDLSLREIGLQFGISRERVRQIAHNVWAWDTPSVTSTNGTIV